MCNTINFGDFGHKAKLSTQISHMHYYYFIIHGLLRINITSINEQTEYINIIYYSKYMCTDSTYEKTCRSK